MTLIGGEVTRVKCQFSFSFSHIIMNLLSCKSHWYPVTPRHKVPQSSSACNVFHTESHREHMNVSERPKLCKPSNYFVPLDETTASQIEQVTNGQHNSLGSGPCPFFLYQPVIMYQSSYETARTTKTNTCTVMTSYIVSIKHCGDVVAAQYGKRRGTPSEQGSKVVQFLSKAENIQRLKKGLSHTSIVHRK